MMGQPHTPDTREEATAKLPALHILMVMGWEYLPPAACLGQRGSERAVLLEDVLRDHLSHHRFDYKGQSHALSPAGVAQVIRAISAAGLSGPAGYLPLPDVLRISRDVLQGLEYLHARSFFHNDIKPENILLGPHGQGMLSDYGVTGVSANGAPVAAPNAYVFHRAPEVVVTGNIGASSDIFQVGMTLARLLINLNHLRAVRTSIGHAQYDQAIAEGKLLTQKDFPDHIPAAVRRIVLKAVHPDLGQRFSSALEIRRALEKLDYLGRWTVDDKGNEIGKCKGWEFSHMVSPVTAGKFDVTCIKHNIASGKTQRVAQFCKRGLSQSQAKKIVSSFKNFVVTGR